ncbi:hypothetical protein BH11MYX2_BH11MYX2_12800 [soil metagenome]
MALHINGSMFHRRASLMFAIVLCVFTACAAQTDDEPSSEELDDLDSWAIASDGKADLPNTWTDVVAYVKDFYLNRMTAVWHSKEHPATAAAAIARVRQMAQQAGIADPTHAYYRTSVQRMRVQYFDHSELNVQIGGPTKVVRLVGDSHGAGVYVDNKLFQETIGPKLCLSWDELQDAIETSYVPGHYGVDFVCHTITEKVLRALDVGSGAYSPQLRTYSIADWIWGPLLPSFNSTNPRNWSESRTNCGPL